MGVKIIESENYSHMKRFLSLPNNIRERERELSGKKHIVVKREKDVVQTLSNKWKFDSSSTVVQK